MTKNRSSGSTAGKSSSSPRAVSPARLHQASGANNAFGGYAKVNHNNGTYSMRKTAK